MKKLFFLTMALVVVSLTGARADIIDFADPLYLDPTQPGRLIEGVGTIYYKLNTEDHTAKVVSGTWQYRDVVTIPDEVEFYDHGDDNNPLNYQHFRVTTITSKAFNLCQDLKEVVLGQYVETIESSAFYICSGIKINLDSKGLKYIKSSAFNQTPLKPNTSKDTLLLGENIELLSHTNDVTDYGSNWATWSNFSGIKFIKVAEGNTHFINDNEGVLYTKDGKTLISFPQARNITEYTIADTVTTVRGYAFYSVDILQKVSGGNGIVRLGSVISGDKLTSFHVAKSVTKMSTTAFMYCGAENFLPDVDSNNPYFLMDGNALYKKKEKTLDDGTVISGVILCRFFKKGKPTSFVLPSNVIEIGSYAFYSNTYLLSIDFQNCTYLESADVAGTAFHSTAGSLAFLNADDIFVNIGGVLYTADTTAMVIYGTGVTLSDYVMPKQTKSVPVGAIKKNTHVKTFAINKALVNTNDYPTNTEYWDNMESLERYSVEPKNDLFSADTAGVLYNPGKSTLISYPRGNTRLYYKVDKKTTQLSVRAFYRNRFLKVLDLGENITSVVSGNNNALALMDSLKAIRIGTLVPPKVVSATFTGYPTYASYNAYLFVPKGTNSEGLSGKDIYNNTAIWNKFYHIVDTSEFDEYIRTQINIQYEICHLKQNILNDEYTLAESTIVKNGKLFSTTAVEPNNYDGFTVQQYNQITLINNGMKLEIKYNRNPYTLTWKNGEETISEKTYKYGSNFTNDIPSDPTAPAGKHFIGWNTNPTATVAFTFNGTETVGAEDKTYYAIFVNNDPRAYQVNHYQQNDDGSWPTEPTETESGEAPFGSLVPAVAKEYTGFTAQDFNLETIAENGGPTVVNIKYDRHQHTVNWMANGELFGGNDYNGSFYYGSALQIPNSEPESPDATYHFLGWNTDASAKIALQLEGEAVPDNNITYNAIFVLNDEANYTIKHCQQDLNGNYDYDHPDYTSTGSGTIGSITDAVAMQITGFKAKAVNNVTIAAGNTTVVVIEYEREKYAVAWMVGNNAFGGTSVNNEFYYGSKLQVPNDIPSAAPGKRFVGWNTDATAPGGIIFSGNETVNGATTYYAIFVTNNSKSYTVEHWQENADNNEYTLVDTDSGEGIIGLETEASANTYPGFKEGTFSQVTIEENTSTVVRIEYKRNTHALEWDGNGGTLSGNYTSGLEIKYGATIIPPTAIRDGYSYGWSTTANGQSGEAAATMPDNDLKYYAIWTPIKYRAHWYYNNGTNDEFNYFDFDFDAPITPPDGIPQPAEYDGHHDFVGWSSSKTGSVIENGNYGRMTTAGATFYAIWQLHSNQLVWDANGGSIAVPGTNGLVEYGATIQRPSDPTFEGHTFKGWGTTANATTWLKDEEIATTMPDKPITYYAVWETNRHTITWNANGGDELSGDYTKGEFDYGTPIIAPETESMLRKGYDFEGWGETADATSGVTVEQTLPDRDLQYFAIWKVHEHNLTWKPNGGYFVDSDPSGLVAYGTPINRPTVDRGDEWTCAGWGLSEDSEETITPESEMPDHDLTYYAIWIPSSGKQVKWKLNDGTEHNYTVTIVADDEIITPPANNPEYIHHDFIGWANQAGQIVEGDEFGTWSEDNRKFYAQWQNSHYTLTWDANEGQFNDGSIIQNELEYDEIIIVPNDPERFGYTFKGWALTSDAISLDVITPDATMPDKALTYYAVWKPNSYDVLWLQFNNGVYDIFSKDDVEFNAKIVPPLSNPIRAHYQFMGWSATPNGAVIEDLGTLQTEGAKYYAQWQLCTYTLVWDANGGTLSGDYTEGSVGYGTTIVAPTASKENSIFAGWSTPAKPDSVVSVTTMPDSNVTYIATWLTMGTSIVEWKLNDGTDQNFFAASVKAGATIVPPTESPKRVHYTFLGWSDEEDGSVLVDFGTMPEEGTKTFYAIWQLNKYMLTWNANGGNFEGENQISRQIEYGAAIVPPTTEPTRADNIFVGWALSPTATNTVTVASTMPDAALTYYAVWANAVNVVLWKINDGTDNNYMATNVESGNPIVAPENNPERDHYQFMGWSNEINGDVLTDFGTMDNDNKIFYAQWQLNTYMLSWNANGGELSGDYTNGSVEYGAAIVPPTATRNNYLFMGWALTNDATQALSEIVGTMPDNDITYYAVWKITNKSVNWMFSADSIYLSTMVRVGEPINAPAVNPERHNFTFAGWAATIDSDNVIDNFGVMPETDTAFFAVWEAVLYEATWMVNNGTDAIFATTQASVSTTLVAPDSIPQRENYAFSGWSTTADGTPMSDIEMPEGGITLYAIWNPNQFTAIWKMNDGTDNNFETIKVEMGQPITAPAKTPTRQYYNFVGWSKTAQGTVTTDFGTMTANGAEFFAIWDAIVEFTAPESFVTCEREQIIKLSNLSNNEITFSWNVNGKIDASQTGPTFDIPDDAAFSGTITITGSFGGKDVAKSITYQRKKMMTRTLWDDVITVVNPDTAFASYRWYHNGALVDTTEYHVEAGGLTGKYYLVATTQSGVEICSCESDFGSAPEATMSAYPNPTVDNITVAGSLIEAGATISIIDGNGKEWLRKTVENDGSETIGVSQMPQGMYIVKVGNKVVSFIKL